MNWKLSFQLSAFGLIMAIATISLIPEKVEPAFWFVIFIFCAYVIAKVAGGKYFWHGLLVSIINCVWITAAHIICYKTYEANHLDMVKMTEDMPMSNHPRLLMLLMGPLFGVMFGLILGLFSFVASMLVKPKPVAG